jgi:hypothetical protein
LGVASFGRAASINYGDFTVPPGVTFTQVTETSVTDPLPLFGPPSPYSAPVPPGPLTFEAGMDFTPQSFASSSAGGGADTTLDELDFGVMQALVPGPPPLLAINAVSVQELGDYTLAGVGTAATQASAGLTIAVTVTHIDGVDVPDVAIPAFNASLLFDLLSNPGASQPWQLSGSVDIQGYLASQSIPFQVGATKVEVHVENLLEAQSEPASAALILKKEFIVAVDAELVPEPATCLLGAFALGGLGLGVGRRRA